MPTQKIALFTVFAIVLAGGCAASHPAPVIGLIPPGQRAADLRDDQRRLLGEDRAPAVPLDVPFFEVPFYALGAATNFLIVQPIANFYDNFTGNTEEAARIKMFDPRSADSRRYGTFRVSDFYSARMDPGMRDIWANNARNDPDYTVRAASVRVLNRCRDAAHASVYVAALNEQQPLVRLEAVKALANVPDPDAVPALLDLLQHDVSRDVRIASADALRCYKTDEVAHALILVLDDYDFGVAWQARQSLRLMTARDFQYNETQWLDYLAASSQPFPPE